MNILMAASEFSPLVRLGDLADSVAGLADHLRVLGHEVSVILPYYRAVREGKAAKIRKTGVRFSVPVGSGRFPCEIHECKVNGVQVFLVGRDEYFDRSGLYGIDGRDYQDNAARFIFFTKCAIELARRAEPPPSILHLHGWQTALGSLFVRDQRLPFRTVLTPHSLEYQGNFWSYDFGLTNLPESYFSPQGVEYFGSMNCLKTGILFSDAVVLPGERFVSASQAAECGCGLERVLREHQHKLVGIIPPDLVQGWAAANRSAGSAAFLSSLGLDAEASATFVAFTEASSRLEPLLGALDRLLVENVRVALLGPIRPEYSIPVEIARRKHRGRFMQQAEFDDALARQALAAADFHLVPGPVEASAKWIQRSLVSGAITVAAQCGGLYQLVRKWEPGVDRGNGFVFYDQTAEGLLDACRRGLRTMADTPQWQKLRDHSAAYEISEVASARDHVALYERLTGASALRAA